MAGFTTPLRYAPTGAHFGWRPVYRLTAALEYELSPGIAIAVAPGFETDFASVPKNPWIGPGGPLAEAATLHDWAYRLGTFPGRELADALFLQAMRDSRVPEAEAQLCYRAVRAFGGSSFERLPVDHRFPAP